MQHKHLFHGLMFLAAAAVCIPAFAPAACAEKAATTDAGKRVMATVDEVRKTVEQESGKLSAEQLDEKLKSIIFPVFDFDEMSKRSLGAKWRDATEPQRAEFVKLFSDLLARNYLKKIRENVTTSKVSLVSDSLTDANALVRTMVVSEKQSAAIDYRLRNQAGHWRVYDVIIENIGLVSNYRGEFAGIIRKEGMDGLLSKLREKKIGDKVSDKVK